MSHCLNLNCPQPQNVPDQNFCIHCGTRLLLAERYRPLSLLGVGGMGRNFLAIDEHTPKKRKCVIKQFSPHPDILSNTQALAKSIELFNREAATLDDLGEDHPQIPKLLAYFEQDKRLYFVQEFIEGQNLLQDLRQNGIYSESQIIHLLNQILPILQYIHQKSVIHRDLKPENIMQRSLSKDLVLIDFGISRELSGTVMSIGTKVGTIGYAPVEQMMFGQAVSSSDIYALGATCIHLLTNTFPDQLFDLNTYQWIWKNKLTSNISPHLTKILDKMLQINIPDRYQNVQDVLNDLRQTSSPPSTSQKSVLIVPPTIITPPQKQIQLLTDSFDTPTVNNEGVIIRMDRHTHQYFRQDLGQGIFVDMVSIPPGSFMMGALPNEAGANPREYPRHLVNIKYSFFVGKFPVTQAQWRVVAAYPKVKIDLNADPSHFKGNDLPVESITWDEAKEFCDRLSAKTGLKYRLTSEAEWEYICRANVEKPFTFGDTITTELVNFNGDYVYGNAPKGKYRKTTTAVGRLYPNAFGLYDVHGNVWEWCEDDWHGDYDLAPKDGSAWLDSINNAKAIKVSCGGAWSSYPQICRSANRNWLARVYRRNYLGFRLGCFAASS